MTSANWITVTIKETKGSAPRDSGAAMQVFAEGQTGSIGGGTLEWEATRIARDMLMDAPQDATSRVFPLGPALGQCCGGTVTLSFERGAAITPITNCPLWIWGAGHVGRAVAKVIAPLEDRRITLVDDHTDRLPSALPATVAPLVAATMPRAVRHAPQDAAHLIMTYAHDIDLALCDALLHHGFAQLGLIGSATKWARFQSRLRAMGHTDTEISRITCPIGDPKLGKHPQVIAIGVASALLSQ
jgi:xanthine dehydrogenase accessory factor